MIGKLFDLIKTEPETARKTVEIIDETADDERQVNLYSSVVVMADGVIKIL